MKPQIIAHTGCEGTTDNTLASSLAGRNAGAEVLEVDVRATKDGVCVLYHDDHSCFSEYTYEQIVVQNLLQLPVGRSLERLQTVLNEFRGQSVSFNLDLKNDKAANPTMELLETMEMLDQIYFTGDTDRIINHPYRTKVMWNTPPYLRVLGAIEYEANARKLCSMVKQAGCAGINVDYPSCRDILVQCAHEYGLKVWIYTLQDTSLFDTYAAMNVDAISTLKVSENVSLRARLNTPASS
jgi:glycerophosphoryl diester phosphodiesterase